MPSRSRLSVIFRMANFAEKYSESVVVEMGGSEQSVVKLLGLMRSILACAYCWTLYEVADDCVIPTTMRAKSKIWMCH